MDKNSFEKEIFQAAVRIYASDISGRRHHSQRRSAHHDSDGRYTSMAPIGTALFKSISSLASVLAIVCL